MIKQIKCCLGFYQWEEERGEFNALLSTYCDRDECWTNTNETFVGGWFQRLKPLWGKKKKIK